MGFILYMPIIFISLSETYTEKIKQHGFEAKTMKIQDYIYFLIRLMKLNYIKIN